MHDPDTRLDPFRFIGIIRLLFSCSVVSDSSATPCAMACQVPLSMKFPRQNIGVGGHTSSGHLPHPEIEPVALVLVPEPTGKPQK